LLAAGANPGGNAIVVLPVERRFTTRSQPTLRDWRRPCGGRSVAAARTPRPPAGDSLSRLQRPATFHRRTVGCLHLVQHGTPVCVQLKQRDRFGAGVTSDPPGAHGAARQGGRNLPRHGKKRASTVVHDPRRRRARPRRAEAGLKNWKSRPHAGPALQVWTQPTLLRTAERRYSR
jgi:hypothetical protein